MALQLIKPQLKTQKLFWNPLSISRIRLEEVTTLWFSVKRIHGLMELSKNLLQLIPILENTQRKFLIPNQKNNHGSELNKNIFYFNSKIVFKLGHTDGLILVSQEAKVLITVQLEEMSTLADQSLMLIINAVFTLELKFLVQMLKYFLVNGNSKLDHVLELSKEITYGQQDIYYKDVQKSTIYQ